MALSNLPYTYVLSLITKQTLNILVDHYLFSSEKDCLISIQRRRKVQRSGGGGGSSNVVGIICHLWLK